jgi:hypothetical protein
MKKIMEERMERSQGKQAQISKFRVDIQYRLKGEWCDQHRKR